MKTISSRLLAAAALTALMAGAATPVLAQTGQTGRAPLTTVGEVLYSNVDDYPVDVTGTIVK